MDLPIPWVDSTSPWESGNLPLETPVLSLAGCWPQKSLSVDSVLTSGWQNFEEVFVNNVLAGNLCSLFSLGQIQEVCFFFFLLFQTTIIKFKNCLKTSFSHIIPSQSVLSHLCEHCGKKPVLLWKMGGRGEAGLESMQRVMLPEQGGLSTQPYASKDS